MIQKSKDPTFLSVVLAIFLALLATLYSMLTTQTKPHYAIILVTVFCFIISGLLTIYAFHKYFTPLVKHKLPIEISSSNKTFTISSVENGFELIPHQLSFKNNSNNTLIINVDIKHWFWKEGSKSQTEVPTHSKAASFIIPPNGGKSLTALKIFRRNNYSTSSGPRYVMKEITSDFDKDYKYSNKWEYPHHKIELVFYTEGFLPTSLVRWIGITGHISPKKLIGI